MVCDCSVICILLLLSTSQTLEQTDKLQKLFQLQTISSACSSQLNQENDKAHPNCWISLNLLLIWLFLVVA